MADKKKPRFPLDLIGLLLGALLLGALLIYGAVTKQPLPILPALAVIAVNIVAAWRMAARIRRQRNADSNKKAPMP